MKVYALVDRDSGRVMGYRFKSILGVYDVSKDILPVLRTPVEKIMGYIENGIFRTDDKDVFVEVDENSDMLEILKSVYGISKTGYSVYLEDRLHSLIKDSLNYNRRYFVADIEKFLFSSSSKPNLLTIVGVRRTGKTVSMYHCIDSLLRSGVSSKEIAYIIIKGNNNMDSEDLGALISLLFSCGVKYLFLDEASYVDGKLDFALDFTESGADVRVVMTGTDSLVFLESISGELYDRSLKISTSYMSFREYKHLFPESDILGYIRNGGIMMNSVRSGSVVQEYIDFANEFTKTAFVDNLFHCFDRYNMGYEYPNMYMYYSGHSKNLSTLIAKWVQVYSQILTVNVVEKAFKSGDIGVAKKFLKEEDSGSNFRSFAKELTSMLEDEIGLKSSPGYTDDIGNEIKEYLDKIECYCEIPNSGSEYVLPIAVRFGYACLVIKLLSDRFDYFSKKYNITISHSEICNKVMTVIEGSLIEDVIRLEIYKKGLYVSKYRSEPDGREIDLVLSDALIEVKRSEEVYLSQMRWLLKGQIHEDLGTDKKLVLLTRDPYERIVECSEKEAVGSLIESRIEKGLPVGQMLQKEYDGASIQKKKVYCLNIEKFLERL